MLDIDSIVIELIRLQWRQDLWHDKLEDCGLIELSEPISGDYLLLNLALTILGVPEDNTVETNACEIANTTGEWPEGSFCRDSFTNEYCEKVDETEASIRRYVAKVRKWMREINGNTSKK